MHEKLRKDWLRYSKKLEYSEDSTYRFIARMEFERKCRYALSNNAKVDWQEDGGVIVAGVIAFSLT